MISVRVAVFVELPDSKPWFLVETYTTTDGIRTRVCDGRWSSREDAAAECSRRIKRHTP